MWQRGMWGFVQACSLFGWDGRWSCAAAAPAAAAVSVQEKRRSKRAAGQYSVTSLMAFCVCALISLLICMAYLSILDGKEYSLSKAIEGILLTYWNR